jgi:polyphosphate kinase
LFQNFNEKVNQDTREYNSYCQGTFPKGEYEKRKSWCDENESRIQADQKKRTQIGEAITQRLGELEDRKKKLSDDTLNWFKQKKENNAKWEDWEVSQKDWMGRYQRLMIDPMLNDLKLRAKTSTDCANMPTLEDAHQCLQSIWDGARRKTQGTIKKKR